MHRRATPSGLRGRLTAPYRRPPARGRRPAVYLGTAAAGAVLVNVLVATGPAANAEPVDSQTMSVARQLGIDGSAGSPDLTRDLEPLADLAASRSSREAAQISAQWAQAAADQAVLDRQRAEAEAAAAFQRAAEEAAAAAERAAQQAAAQRSAAPSAAAAAPRTAAGSVASGIVARISNSAGPVAASVQAAANAVVSNVPGADSITIGGTRASAADPAGHPSGKALDWMAIGTVGDALVAYHIANWDALGVEYIIYKQRMLSSPGGSWQPMEDRGSVTANHLDHAHVNYR